MHRIKLPLGMMKQMCTRNFLNIENGKKNVEDKIAVDLGNKKGKENIKNLDF